jgi:hypothetical protein
MAKHKGSEQRVKGAEQRQQAQGHPGQNREAPRQHEGGVQDRGGQQAHPHGQEPGKPRADEHNR